MVSEQVASKLSAIKGLITEEEGRQLARMARSVPSDLAIIEMGSYRGQSSCWLAAGSVGAHVTCIDPWPLYNNMDAIAAASDAEWDERGALERWMENVDSLGLWHRITPLRARASEVANMWAKPVGLWFHDADHSYEGVRDDFLAWKPYLADGAWIAVHDFCEGLPDGNGGWVRTKVEQRAVADHILTSGRFTDVKVVGNLWVGCRWFK